MGLLQRAVATGIGITIAVAHNWGQRHAEPEVKYYPALFRFLGYIPLPEPRTLGQAHRRERMSRGWLVVGLG